MRMGMGLSIANRKSDGFLTAPVIDLNGATAGINANGTFTEGDGATTFLGSATVTDADDTELASITIVGTNGFGENAANDIVAWGAVTFPSNADKTADVTAGATTISVAFVTATKTFTCTKSGGGTIPIADAQTFVRAFSYNNTATPPDTSARVFTFVTNDGTDNSATATLTVTVAATTAGLTFTDAITWDQDDGDIDLLADLAYTSATGSCVEGTLTLGGFADGDNEIVQLGERIFEAGTSRTTYCYHRGVRFSLDYDEPTGVITAVPTFVASVTDEVMQSLMRTARYWRLGAGLTIGDRTVAVSLDDGTNAPLTDTLTVSTQVVLTIHVVDYDGVAISGASVVLKDPLSSTIASGTSDGSGLCTFTIAENGAGYVLEVTKSGKQDYFTVRSISGNQNICVMLFTNAVTIDGTWLADTANLCDTDYTTGPYKLTASDTLYTMTTGLTSDLQAFVFRAKCGLNFNGQDIVYGNEAPVGLTNEGFETGDFTGWDTSAAPSAQVVANAETGATGPYLWGSYCCQFTNLNGAETISQVMAIPEADRQYRATVWQSGLGSDGSSVKIEAIDNVTESSLGSTTNTAAGAAASVVFTPTTTNDVRIEVTVTTLSTKSPKVDDIRVRHADVFAISLSPSLTGLSSWAQGLVGTVFGVNGGAIYDSLGTGSITQGQGESDTADVYRCYSSSGYVVIDNTTFENVGTNSLGCQAIYKGSTLAFTNNTYDANGHNHHSTNRQAIMAAVSMTQNPDAALFIENNTFTDLAQQGIAINEHSSADSRIIRNNTFSTDARITNAYAISAANGEVVDILYNTINTGSGKSGRGILFDDILGDCPTGSTIAFNDVAVRERGNYEYGFNGLEATGLRIREFSHSQTDNTIRCNRFYAYTDDTLVHTAMAHRASYGGDTESTGMLIEDNIFRAVVGTTSTTYSATAVEIAASLNNSGDPVDYKRNWMDSNDQSLVIGGRDTDGKDAEDCYFWSSDLTKSADGSARTYKTTYLYGNTNNTGVSNVRMIDTVYGTSASQSNITWTGSGLKDIGFYYTAEAEITGGNAADLVVADDGAVEVFSGTANSSGYVSGIVMLHTLYEQETSSPSSITTTVKGDYEFTASLIGETDGTATVTADQPRYIPMDFDTAYGPPVLTPPATVNATLGDTGVSATITNSGSAADYTELASGTIPDDLALSGLVISGDVNAGETPGTYEPVVRAINAYGSDTATVTFEIDSGITSPVHEGAESATTAIANLVINVPSGGTDGDRLLAIVHTTSRTCATPSGWTLLDSSEQPSVGNNWLYVFSRTRSSEPANYTFAQSAGGNAVGWMLCTSGGGTPAITFLHEGYSTPQRFPDVTPAENASLVYRIGGTYNNRTLTDRTENGHTDIGMVTSAGATLGAMWRNENSAASGVLSFTLSGGGYRNSVVIVIPPA